MRTSVIVVLGLLCVFASAESIFAAKQDAGIFTELQQIENSDFGKKLLDTIALQFKNKSPLGDISKLLNDIRNELLHQQEKADVNEASAVKTCEKEIANYNARIATASNEISEALTNIVTYKNQIELATRQKESYESQIKILKEREEIFRAARKADEASFAKRIDQQRAVIAALKQIVPELERIKPHGNIEAALVELAKIGKTNPIGAFLQVAMTLDQGALVRVIQNLKKLRKSVEASIKDDLRTEEEAQRNFRKLLEEFEQERSNLQKSLSLTIAQIETAKNNLANQQTRLANNQAELNLATKGKKQMITHCDERKARYNAEKSGRAKEIAVVDAVLKIIATRLENVQDYVKARADGK